MGGGGRRGRCARNWCRRGRVFCRGLCRGWGGWVVGGVAAKRGDGGRAVREGRGVGGGQARGGSGRGGDGGGGRGGDGDRRGGRREALLLLLLLVG